MQVTTGAKRHRLNEPMVSRLRQCAADTSANWDGRITIYPTEARQLVDLIDAAAEAEPIAAHGQDREAAEYQWGVRTTYMDGSQGTDWTNEGEATNFLTHYAWYDTSRAMHVQTRELVRRPVAAGAIEVVESSYAELRAAADFRRG